MTTAPAGAQVRLRPVAVFRDAMRVYREHWPWLWTAALIVFGPLALLDGAIEHWDMGDHPLAATAESGLQSLVHLVGDVFYAGLVAAAVIAWREGAPRHGILHVARTLPWATIATLDFLLPIGTVVLALLLVVPGIVFYTYFALAPAVAKLDHVGAREALRRSHRMVRGNFWRVLAVLVGLIVGAGIVEQGLQALVPAYIGDVAVNLAVAVVGAPLYAVCTILMAYDLRRA